MKKSNCSVFLAGLLSMVAFLYSCDKSLYVTYSNYVSAYVFEESLRTIHYKSDDMNHVFRIASHDPKANFISPHSTGEDKKLFEALSVKNKDTSYNRKFIENDLDDINHSNNVFFAERITDISITSDTDWNSDYPAGASLNDLFLYLSCSPDAYILNGYKKVITESYITTESIDVRLQDLLSWTNANSGDTTTPIYGVLSDIEFEKYNLLGISGIIGWFAPTVLPDNPKSKMKITVTFENGKTSVLEDSLTP